MQRMAGLLRVCLLLCAELGAVIVIRALGRQPWLRVDWHRLLDWMATNQPADTVAALAWLAATVVVAWLVASTALYAAAALFRWRGAVHSIGWATLPGIRRIVDGALALGLSAAVVAPASSALAAEPPLPIIVEIDDAGRPVPPGTEPIGARTSPPLDRIRWEPTPAGTPADPPVAPPRRSVLVDGDPGSHVVTAGDNLWTIAATHLAAIGRPASDTGRYWRAVIDANRDRLRSGDPDLIYPGETILLPPIEAAP